MQSISLKLPMYDALANAQKDAPARGPVSKVRRVVPNWKIILPDDAGIATFTADVPGSFD